MEGWRDGGRREMGDECDRDEGRSDGGMEGEGRREMGVTGPCLYAPLVS